MSRPASAEDSPVDSVPDAPDPEPGATESDPVDVDLEAEDVTAPATTPLEPVPGEVHAAIVDERDALRDLAQRTQAELENFRKQQLKRQTELVERAGEGVLQGLLPVLDAFDGARSHHPDDESIKALWGVLWPVLEKEGLERVDEIGAPFDPTQHEAVSHLPAEGDPGDGGPTVVQVLRTGYRFKGRVLRAAVVVVQD